MIEIENLVRPAQSECCCPDFLRIGEYGCRFPVLLADHDNAVIKPATLPLVKNMTTQNSPDPQLSSNNPPAGFQDRRDPNRQRKSTGLERRQFSDGHNHLSPEAAEVGRAVDKYKLENHRRFVTYEELLAVIKSLGYAKKGS